MMKFGDFLKLHKKQRPFSRAVYFPSSGNAVWSDRDYRRFAEQGYIRNVIAHRVVMLIANAVSSVSLVVARHHKDGTRKVLRGHPLEKLLRQPNPSTPGVFFREQVMLYKLISGNAYILKLRDSLDHVQELHLLRPDRIRIETNSHGQVVAYHYYVGGEEVKVYKVDQLTGQSDVLHLKNFHPTNEIYGLSPFESAFYSVEQHNQACIWNQSLLQNSARPSGALIVKGEDAYLSEEQYNRLRNEINEFFSGGRNAGRPLLLEGGLEWKEMGISPKDMDFINAKDSMARDIALAFGVPPQLLGLPDDNRYAHALEARLLFWENAVMPALENFLGYLNNWMSYDFGESIRLEYNKEEITAFTQQREQLWNQLDKIGFLTTNEKRAMVGLPPTDELPVSAEH